MVVIGREIDKLGLQKIKDRIARDRDRKASDPKHRVIIDVGMEYLCSPRTADIVKQTGQEHCLADFAGMRKLDIRKVAERIQELKLEPPGGAGGLGIVEETVGYAAREYSIYLFSLLHTARRIQSFAGNRQRIEFIETQPEKTDNYSYLGELSSVKLHDEERAVATWLFNGFSQGDAFVPDFLLSLPPVTGSMYAPFNSKENFAQMQVLGQGGFRLAQYFGLIGVENPIADLVIGHDGHTALFKFNLYLWILGQGNDPALASEMTRELCAATIHAPQGATAPQTVGSMVRQHYTEEEEKAWGMFGNNPGNPTNALFVEMGLSRTTGVVSPVHLMVTQAEELALRTGASSEAVKLLPSNFDPKKLLIHPDAVAIKEWLGMGTIYVLDKYCPGWQENLGILDQPELIDNLRDNIPFRKDLAEAFSAQDIHFGDLLNDYLPRQFKVDVPENAIILASLRRATEYKIGLQVQFLENYKIIDDIAKELGRPIVYLYGGLAHQQDIGAIDKVERLLDLISEINVNASMLKADFLIGYGIETSKWLFPGLAKRGCWVGATNPILRRSQGTEAFGPSYIKSAGNGLYVLGPDDGGAGCLHDLPTVYVYGPTTFIGQRSLHNNLWGNQAMVRTSESLLTNAFLGGVNNITRRLNEDLLRYEQGRGYQAPGIQAKIESILKVIARYNGRVLIDSYLNR